MADSAPRHVPDAPAARIRYAAEHRNPNTGHGKNDGCRSIGHAPISTEVKVMRVQPLGDRVVVKPKPKEEKTKGGIYLPDTATKERPMQGNVLAVGAGRHADDGKLIPMNVQVGQCCSQNTPAPSSRSTTKSSWFCKKKTSWV
jgi:co-chaperonin GroES (HSP10)